MPRSSTRTLMILLPLFLLVSWLGIRGLNLDSIWLDEYWSIYHAGGAYFEPRTPVDVWMHIGADDPWQPPLYYILLSQWGKLVGWSELAARSLSFFVGMIGIAMAYRLGRDLRSVTVGIATAVVLGSSAYYVYFLHEMRAYTLYVLLTLISAWAYWRLINGKRGLYLYALLFVGLVGALYTHYFAGLIGVVLGLYHLVTMRSRIFRERPLLWWQISGVFALAALAFLPWLLILIRGVTQALSETSVRGLGALSTEQVVRGVLYLFSNGSTGLLVALLGLSIQRRKESIFLWFCAFTLLTLLLAINARLGVLLEVRYLLALWSPLSLLGGLGIERLMQLRRVWGGAVLAVIVAGGVWVTLDPVSSSLLHNPHWHLPWRELRAALQTNVQPDDQVVFLLPDWTWAVYHDVEIDYYLHDLPVRHALIEQPDHYGFAQYQELARSDIGDSERVWVASTPAQPLNHRDEFELLLEQVGYHECVKVADTPELTLNLFARPPGNRSQSALVALVYNLTCRSLRRAGTTEFHQHPVR
ncbi:MAG: glycosyltransferase family 39 protein [Chloroflexi bacterium]|uniref:glycosyltransferase family 39 protein n=1 Tax=Candidatus Flexifilum breve TaxID=3140694 RepID=UPI0031374180|nr:glycosyltransferase family 39 protein [Chloroflexota bacterium]